MKPDISVIIPCYNASRYLKNCLESLSAQRGPEIEMIFIDDGSTDETGNLLDSFAFAEPRAKVLHVKNGGVSAARNLGLDQAMGRYIAFVDADDEMAPDSLALLHRHAVQTGAQIVSANHTVLDVSTNARTAVQAQAGGQMGECIAREIIHMHRIYNNIWNKLYDRALFEGVRLDTRVRIGEDALLNLQLYLRAQSAVHLDADTYVYRVHGGSAMAGVRSHSQAHQPMLCAMSEALLAHGAKERYFKDFLQSCVWIDEKQRGIRACMQSFSERVRPLVLEGVSAQRLAPADRRLYHLVRAGGFPAFYMLMRVREKLTGKKWGIRR